MKNNMLLIILFLLPLLSSTSYANPDQVDPYLCVADTKGPRNPSGYNCKPNEKITKDDFVATKNKVGNIDTDKRFKFSIILIGAQEIHALNGVHLLAAVVETEKGGLIPFHTHPYGTEMIIMDQGQLDVAFVLDKKVYGKILQKGDIFVIPQGLLHYQINSGREKATYYSFFNSARPGFEILPYNLFASDFNAEKLSQATGISVEEVKKIQKRFASKGD